MLAINSNQDSVGSPTKFKLHQNRCQNLPNPVKCNKSKFILSSLALSFYLHETTSDRKGGVTIPYVPILKGLLHICKGVTRTSEIKRKSNKSAGKLNTDYLYASSRNALRFICCIHR